jgi:hypothetical protein
MKALVSTFTVIFLLHLPISAEQKIQTAPTADVSEKTNKKAPEFNAKTSVLSTLGQQYPNIINWLGSPLRTQIPDSLEGNIMLLSERILDEAYTLPENKRKAHGNAVNLCKSLLAMSLKRYEKQVSAKLIVARRTANSPLHNQQLDARRNYLMSWPQYEREVQQRAVLLQYRNDANQVASREMESKWMKAAETLKKTTYRQYKQMRQSMRELGIVHQPKLDTVSQPPVTARMPERDKEAKNFLDKVLSMKWQWNNKIGKGNNWVVFNPDGSLELDWTDGKELRWRVVGPHTIRIHFPKAPAVVTLTWNKTCTRYTGTDINTKTGLKLDMWGSRMGNESLQPSKTSVTRDASGDALTVPNDGLIAHYPFNGNANDESGNGNNALLSGNEFYSAGRYGEKEKSIYIPTNGFIRLPSSELFKSTTMTYSIWYQSEKNIRRDQPNNQICTILDSGPDRHPLLFVNANWKGAGASSMDIGYWDGSWHGSGAKMRVAKWTHFAVVMNGSSYSLYINGANVYNNRTYFGNVGNHVKNIGNFPDDPNTHSARGFFDDVRIYNRALPDSKIKQLYSMKQDDE